MSSTRQHNRYRFFDRTKMMMKQAIYGAAAGAVVGEIYTWNMHSKSNTRSIDFFSDISTGNIYPKSNLQSVDYKCSEWMRWMKPSPFAPSEGNAIVMILGVGLTLSCAGIEMLINSTSDSARLYVRVASTVLGAGMGLISAYYSDMPEEKVSLKPSK